MRNGVWMPSLNHFLPSPDMRCFMAKAMRTARSFVDSGAPKKIMIPSPTNTFRRSECPDAVCSPARIFSPSWAGT